MNEPRDPSNTEIKLSDQDPTRRAQAQMRKPETKRFYETVGVGEDGEAFAVLLDGKHVKTPARNALSFPTRPAAQIIAEEFAAQEKILDPAEMPATRLANTAIDGVATDPQAVAEDILRFCASDLLCYRAGEPEALVQRQSEAWDPVIDWMRARFGARFVLAEGVMHVEQPREAIAVVGSAVLPRHPGPLALACLHTMTTLTGSALLALAIAEEEISAEDAWAAAHVDEDWSVERWGEDAEAATRRALREREMMVAVRVLSALRDA